MRLPAPANRLVPRGGGWLTNPYRLRPVPAPAGDAPPYHPARADQTTRIMRRHVPCLLTPFQPSKLRTPKDLPSDLTTHGQATLPPNPQTCHPPGGGGHGSCFGEPLRAAEHQTYRLPEVLCRARSSDNLSIFFE